MERCPSHILSWSVPHFSHCWMPSPLQAHRGRCCHTHLLLLAIYSSHERVFLPLSLVDFSTWQPVTSLPHSKVAGLGLPLLSSFAGLFIYSLREGVLLPHSLELRAPHPLCFVSFFFQLLIYYSFCPGLYADLSQGVLRATYLLTFVISQTGWQFGSPPGFSV
jgi:hypothetical protein